MKKHIIICCLILVSALSCRKDNFESEGLITGPDPRDCACCGGWFIEIGSATYRFNDLPANSDLDLSKETMPLAVVLKWEKDPDACLGDEIFVYKIRKK